MPRRRFAAHILLSLCQIVRIAGAVCGALSIAIGLYQLITSAFNPRTIINAIYEIIFGLLIWIAEARWSGLLKHFKFLTHFLGLGLFYGKFHSDMIAIRTSRCRPLISFPCCVLFACSVFVGGLALGGEWYQYAEAILCLSVGIIYIILGALCRTMADPDFGGKSATFGKEGYGDPTQAGKVGADGKKNPDAVKDLKKAAAHMAVDHAIENEGANNPFA